MAKAYFYKELTSNPFYVAGGPVEFEALNGDCGILELESPQDDKLIEALTNAARNGVGGVVKFSESQYTEKKTRGPGPYSGRKKELLRVLPSQLGPFNKAKKAAAAAPVEPVPAGVAPVVPTAEAIAPFPTAPTAAPEPPLAPAPPPFKPKVGRVKRTQKSLLA